MGFENRDYTRGSGGYTDQFGSWGFNLDAVPPVVKYLVAANIVVFLLQIFFTRAPNQQDLQAFLDQYGAVESASADDESELAAGDAEDQAPVIDMADVPRVSIVQEWLELDTRKVVRQGQIWRLVTCAFCHDRVGVLHIVFNMLFLWWFGKTMELMYGSREFLLFYLTAAVVASLAFVGLDLVTGSSVPAIGASGAVMAVTMLYACYYPRDTIRIIFFPIEIRWLVLIYVIFDLHPVLLALAGERMFDGVAHAAHLGGLAFGFVYWKYNLRLEPWWDRLPRWRPSLPRTAGNRVDAARPKSRRADPDEQVDLILQKISDQGIESLTENERRILDRASERYKNR